MICDKGYDPGGNALEHHNSESLFPGSHFPAYGRDSGNAWGVQQGKYQEADCCGRREHLGKSCAQAGSAGTG